MDADQIAKRLVAEALPCVLYVAEGEPCLPNGSRRCYVCRMRPAVEALLRPWVEALEQLALAGKAATHQEEDGPDWLEALANAEALLASKPVAIRETNPHLEPIWRTMRDLHVILSEEDEEIPEHVINRLARLYDYLRDTGSSLYAAQSGRGEG